MKSDIKENCSAFVSTKNSQEWNKEQKARWKASTNPSGSARVLSALEKAGKLFSCRGIYGNGALHRAETLPASFLLN